MNNREKALNQLRMYQFAAFESALFLDTHPNNKEALEAHKKYTKMAQEAAMAYTEQFGPLTIADAAAGNGSGWSWVQGPWPWEGDK